MTRCLLVALLVVVAGCGPSEPRDEGPPEEAEQSVAPSAALPSRGEFVENGLQLPGNTRADFLAALGDPNRIVSEAVPNRHVPGVTDTLFTLYYPDLIAHIHLPGPGGELVSSVEVSDNWHLRHAVIGQTPGAIESAFGPPDQRTDTTFTYLCTTCVAADNPVELVIRDGRVQRVRFNYYVD